MQLYDAKGQRLDTMLFIDIFSIARKIAPARFMTMTLHPDRYKELELAAAPPECVELGVTMGPLGHKVMRVTCVKPALNVSDGVAITQDINADPARIVFNVHGVTELIAENLAL